MNHTKHQLHALIHSDECAVAKRYTAIAEKAAESTKKLIGGFRDRADWVSGWGHSFVCPKCAATLRFDIDLDFKLGGEYTCPVCGEKATGQALDEAWVYFYRIHYASHLESVAVLALLGDADALDFLIRYLDFYADTYEGYAPHSAGRPSKLMPQLLDEAVWCTYVLRAIYPCISIFTAEKKQFWLEKLFRPIALLVTVPNLNHSIDNHVLWHMCAAGMVALTFDDPSLMFSIDGEWGIRAHVEKGFTKDGFWFECSQLYHYYALEALTLFCEILADKNPRDPLLSCLALAYIAPMKTSYDGWHIPSMNDGWYPLTLARFADQLHRAVCSIPASCCASELLKQLDTIREKAPNLLDAPRALLLESAPSLTDSMPDTKLAMIHKPMFAILKSGVLAPNHRQDDALSVVLAPVSSDLGTPGYAHPICQSWYVRAASHNTFVVDGAQPHSVLQTHVETTPTSVCAVLDSGWEGVQATRTLTTDGETITDVTDVTLEQAGVIDWFFHLEGVTEFFPAPSEAASLGEGEGYEHFKDIRRLTGDHLTIHAEKDGVSLTLNAPIDKLEAYIAKSPSNPSCNERTTLILRTRGTTAHFAVQYTK